MNATKKLIAIIAVLTVAAGAMSQGQRRGGFGSPYSIVALINRDEVKDELKLSDDQKTKITDALDASNQKRREAFQALGIDFQNMTDDDRKKMAESNAKLSAETNKEIEGILTADQTKRIREISIQHQGATAAADPEFQGDLGVTDDQKAKIADLQKKQMAAMMELFGKMRDGSIDRAGMQEAMKKNGDIMKSEIEKLLTDDQKAKIKSLSGAPFELKENAGGR